MERSDARVVIFGFIPTEDGQRTAIADIPDNGGSPQIIKLSETGT
jgi:hypothetical protein